MDRGPIFQKQSKVWAKVQVLHALHLRSFKHWLL